MSDMSFDITKSSNIKWRDRCVVAVMAAAAALAIFVTFGIVLSLVFETLRFFEKVPVMDFLFGLEWNPQTAIRADQVGVAAMDWKKETEKVSYRNYISPFLIADFERCMDKYFEF